MWAAEEISKALMNYIENWKYTGYPLDVDRGKSSVDVQFYDRLPEGRHIATLEVPDRGLLDQVELGQAYTFEFKVYSAKLSDRLITLLRDEYDVTMDAIYRFELVSIERFE